MDFKGFFNKIKEDASKVINETINDIQHEFSQPQNKPDSSGGVSSELNDVASSSDTIEQTSGVPVTRSVPSIDERSDEKSDLDERSLEAISKATCMQLKMHTSVNAVKVKLIDNSPDIFESKFGGLPYLPSEGEIPRDEDGYALRFLAQIDCAKLASVKSYMWDLNFQVIENFPQTGILQFWIAQNHAWGLDKKKGSKVIWYEKVDFNVTSDQVKTKLEAAPNPIDINDDFPVHGEFGVEFIATNDSIPACDVRFASLFTNEFNRQTWGKPIKHPDELGDYIGEKIWEEMCSSGNKIGGYPGFTQCDPRSEDDDRTILLLQLDSECEDGESHMMWGDLGMCVFLCSADQLKERNFSNVLYHWDCG